MPDKKSFIFYDEWGGSFALLPAEDQAQLLMAILEYRRTGTPPELEGGVEIAFSFIRSQLDRDNERYTRRCERNRQNGAKGGRPKKAEGSSENPQKPRESERLFEKPKKPDNDNEDDDENEDEDDKKENTVGANAPTRPPVVTLPLKSGGGYSVSEEEAREWGRLYPAVDVMQELRKMKGWLDANPSRKKTRKGIRRFANSWLSSEQDKRHPQNGEGIVDMKFAN